MDKLLNFIGTSVRVWMLIPAKAINKISRGRVTPNHITFVSFLGHFLVLWALWQDRPIVAALLLAFFGIMDSLDGALARVQKKQSTQGMFFDAVSDRAKEILLYIGIVQFISISFLYANGNSLSYRIIDWLYYEQGIDVVIWLPVAVLGCSLLTSYIKAKGEMAVAQHASYKDKELNRIFADGLARYEVRMFVIVVGLITGNLLLSLMILLALLIVTLFQRFVRISKALSRV